MSMPTRREVARKLRETIMQTKDPMQIAQLANALAKYLPRPKQARRKKGTTVGSKAAKEPTLEEMVAVVEKQCKEAGKALNGGSSEVA